MDITTKKYIDELDEIKALLHLNDKQLADEIGVTTAMLSNWRTGKAGISARCQNRVIEFYTRIDWKKVGAREKSPPADHLTNYLLDEWKQLTGAEKAEIIALIEAIKERKKSPEPADHSAAKLA